MLPVVTWEAVPSPGPRAERGARAGLLEDELCPDGNDGADGTETRNGTMNVNGRVEGLNERDPLDAWRLRRLLVSYPSCET